MAEKVNILGDGIVSRAILKQINVLEEMQERAMTAGRSDVVFEISDKIFNAVECYDRHINSDCDNSAAAAFDDVLYGRSKPILPPSDRLLGVAKGIYKLENIDGMSVDGILDKIRKAERLGYPNGK